jgi:SAM-dependent methyltransferase
MVKRRPRAKNLTGCACAPAPRLGMQDLLEQTSKFSFKSVLDIGAGDGFASRFFLTQGKDVTATGFDMDSYLSLPLPDNVRLVRDVDICAMSIFPDASFDAVWCSHVLEHVQNPGQALGEIRRVLKSQGMLFLIVPEYAPVLVGGHVCTGWNVGTLMYNLVLSGFNVRQGEFINHCWNVCGFVTRGETPSVELRSDKGDIETLAGYFPQEANVHQHMDAFLPMVRWRWYEPIRARAEASYNRTRRRRRLVNWIPPAVMGILRRLKARVSNCVHTTRQQCR